MKEYQIKDKSIFVVGLLAAFLAFSSFKEEMNGIIIFSSPNGTVSLLAILIVFAILLAMAVYLYALDYIKYTYNTNIQNSFFFKAINWLANLFYSIAIFFPLLIVLLAIINIPLIRENLEKLSKYTIHIWVFNITIAAIYFFGTLLASKSITKKVRENNIRLLDHTRENKLENAVKLFRDGYYSSSIIESYKVLTLYLRRRLLEKNILTENAPPKDIENLVLKNEIIPKQIYQKLEEIRSMRNRAAHLDISFTKEQAESALKTIENIIENKNN